MKSSCINQGGHIPSDDMKINQAVSARMAAEGENDTNIACMRQRWLKELEKAHMESKPLARDQSGVDPDKPLPVAENNASMNGSHGGPRDMPNASVALDSSEAISRKVGENAKGKSEALGQVRTERELANAEKPVQQMASACLIAQVNGACDEGNQSQKTESRELLLPSDLPKWTRNNMHLTMSGDGVVVWIRQADANSGEAISIVRDLQRSLRQGGFKLSQVHLNGHLISTDAQESER